MFVTALVFLGLVVAESSAQRVQYDIKTQVRLFHLVILRHRSIFFTYRYTDTSSSFSLTVLINTFKDKGG